MQKVITIKDRNIVGTESHIEIEYEKLNNYLSNGWKIVDKINISEQSNSEFFFTVMFILEKDN